MGGDRNQLHGQKSNLILCWHSFVYSAQTQKPGPVALTDSWKDVNKDLLPEKRLQACDSSILVFCPILIHSSFQAKVFDLF